MPFTSRVKPRLSQDTSSCIFSCSLKPALIPVCAVCSLTKHCLLCSPCWPHFHHHYAGDICCSAAWVRCICCCHPCAAAWWSLPSRSLVFQEAEEAESSTEPSPQLLGTKQEETAAVATSSPSSDSEWNLKPSLTKSTVEDSAVNTGSNCLERPRLKNSGRPEGKYWKRSHHKSHSSNSGTFKEPHREASVRGKKTKTKSLLGRVVTLPAGHWYFYCKFSYQTEEILPPPQCFCCPIWLFFWQIIPWKTTRTINFIWKHRYSSLFPVIFLCLL